MLNKTATVEQMLRWVVLQLSHAKRWETEYTDIPVDILNENITAFKDYAQAMIMFIYQEIGFNGKHIPYDGIIVPEPFVEYLDKLKGE